MKAALVFAAVIISAQGSNVGRVGGWGPTQPPTTGWPSTAPPPTGWPATEPPPTGWPATEPPPTGWPATEPPTTGWPATEPPPTQGWAPPPPPTTGWAPPAQGWGSHTTDVELSGNLAAVGAGWAASNHAESLNAAGDDIVPADIGMISAGEAVVEQQGTVLQLTNNDGQVASGLNVLSLTQDATASEGITAVISGLSANLGQNGWSGVSGSGASSADGTTNLSYS